jgi:hypothetical protein
VRGRARGLPLDGLLLLVLLRLARVGLRDEDPKSFCCDPTYRAIAACSSAFSWSFCACGLNISAWAFSRAVSAAILSFSLGPPLPPPFTCSL